MINAQLQQGIQAAQAGRREMAYAILRQVVQNDPNNEQGWLWLSGVAGNDEERLYCLRQVLRINPHHQAAAQAARQLEARRQPQPSPPPPPPAPPPAAEYPSVPPPPPPAIHPEPSRAHPPQAEEPRAPSPHERKAATQSLGFDLVLKALEASLDRRKVGFAIGGLFVTTLVAGLLFFIASEVSSTFLMLTFTLLAAIAGWVLSTAVAGTVARMSYEELSGRPTPGWQAALAYARRHLISLLFSPLLLWIGILLVVLAEVILLFLGRIPYLGELWAALLFLPLVALNLFLILLGYLGTWLIPAVVAGEGSGVLDTLRRVQEMVRRSPGRLLAYLSIAVILGLLAASVIVPLVYSATTGTASLTMSALGAEKVAQFALAIPDLLGSILLPDVLHSLGRWGYEAPPVTIKIASLIYTLAFLLIPVTVLAVLFVVFPISCACATYLSVGEATPIATGLVAAPAPPRQPAKTFCIRCGAELSPDDLFCVHCGATQRT